MSFGSASLSCGLIRREKRNDMFEIELQKLEKEFGSKEMKCPENGDLRK